MGDISNCYAAGSVIGGTNVGGLVGFSYGNILNCYSKGSVSGISYDGGLIGRKFGYSVQDSFWDTETSGTTISDGGTGKTTIEMQDENTFTNWEFQSIWEMGVNAYLYPIVKDLVIWDGSASSYWHLSGNWKGNIIPTLNDNVYIPNLSNLPVINDFTNAECNNLKIGLNSLINIKEGGSIITSGEITNNGEIILEKSISENQWHYFSSPISAATSEYFIGNYMQTWNEPTATWQDVTSDNYPLIPGIGYAVYFDDRSEISLAGDINNGTISVPLTYNEVSGSSADGANLLGNPYPSSIDWEEVEGYGAVYYWDGDEYLAYPETGAYGLGSQYIPPMQGFFIIVPENSSSSFTFTNSMRTHEGATNYYKSEKVLTNGLIISAISDNFEDKLLIRHNYLATANFDSDQDAYKLSSGISGKSEIWSLSNDNKKLSIDIRQNTEIIQLGFSNDQSGEYSIKLNYIDGFSSLVLEDNKGNIFHDLDKSSYSFYWEAGDSEDRFVIHLDKTGVSEAENQSINIYSSGGLLNVYMKNPQDFSEFQIYDLSGRLIDQKPLTKKQYQTFDINSLSGLYIVKLSGEQKTKSIKVRLYY